MFEGQAITIIDIILVVMLGVANYYLFILIKNIKHLRNAKEEMQQISKELTHNVTKAENSITGLKAVADKKGVTLQKAIEDGEQIIHELEYIYQAANNLAQRLDGAVSDRAIKEANKASDKGDKNKNPSDNEQKSSTKDSADMTKAERELAEALDKKASQ